MMMELIEAKTTLTDLKSIILRRPEKWRESTYIKRFLADTQIMAWKDLCEVRP